MDDPLPITRVGGNTVSEETDDSTQSERYPKDDGMVLAQPAIDGIVTPLAQSVDDPSSKDVVIPFAPDAENPSYQDAQNPLV